PRERRLREDRLAYVLLAHALERVVDERPVKLPWRCKLRRCVDGRDVALLELDGLTASRDGLIDELLSNLHRAVRVDADFAHHETRVAVAYGDAPDVHCRHVGNSPIAEWLMSIRC